MLFWRFLYLAPVERCFTQVQMEVDVCQVEFSGKNRWQVDDVHGMFPFLDRKGSWVPATLMATASLGHGDCKGPPGRTLPPSPLLYYEGVARCQVFDERPIGQVMQRHTPIRKGDKSRSSCIVV